MSDSTFQQNQWMLKNIPELSYSFNIYSKNLNTFGSIFINCKNFSSCFIFFKQKRDFILKHVLKSFENSFKLMKSSFDICIFITHKVQFQNSISTHCLIYATIPKFILYLTKKLKNR